MFSFLDKNIHTVCLVRIQTIANDWIRLQVLDPVRVSIEDESGGEEQKLVVQVVSREFEGLNTLKRHRKVYGLLEDEMKVVHAVTLQTKTPEEVGL